jgi:hypothetical protein
MTAGLSMDVLRRREEPVEAVTLRPGGRPLRERSPDPAAIRAVSSFQDRGPHALTLFQINPSAFC